MLLSFCPDMIRLNVKPSLKRLAFLAVLALAAGCGKKAETPATNSTTTAPAASADTTPAPSAASPETIVNNRSLAYLRALVERKDYVEARKALKEIDARTFSPAEQKTLDDLKARIPNG